MERELNTVKANMVTKSKRFSEEEKSLQFK